MSIIGERFIGSISYNLIMTINKLRGKLTPIKIEQSTLNKFFPELPKPTEESLPSSIEEKMKLFNGDQYH